MHARCVGPLGCRAFGLVEVCFDVERKQLNPGIYRDGVLEGTKYVNRPRFFRCNKEKLLLTPMAMGMLVKRGGAGSFEALGFQQTELRYLRRRAVAADRPPMSALLKSGPYRIIISSFFSFVTLASKECF